ncbi:MAG: prolyl oligopeptidase family serine peptidase [Gammaproteobacteria bacterium]|nr:prolyl oligopeptidase family serine peptidase [Gammaproteobacteria bacterium]
MPPRRERHYRLHGYSWTDEFAGFDDLEDPGVDAYIDAERRYTVITLQPLAELRRQISVELRCHRQESEDSTVIRENAYDYYYRYVLQSAYPVHLRRQLQDGAEEQVILNENELCGDGEYLDVAALAVSPDGRYLAYTVDRTGAERYTLYCRDLTTNVLLDSVEDGVAEDIVWSNDSAHYYYVKMDEHDRPNAVFRHQIGSDASDDRIEYLEDDPQYLVTIRRSRSRQFVFVDVQRHSGSEVWFKPADEPHAALQCIAPRADGFEYYVEHQGQRFVIVTNDCAPTFRAMQAPIADPGRNEWRPLLPQYDDVSIEYIDAFERFLVVGERAKGQDRVRIVDCHTGIEHNIAFADDYFSLQVDEAGGYDSMFLRLHYSTFINPSVCFDYHMLHRTWELVKQDGPDDYEASEYRSDRLLANANDGVAIPVSLVYRADKRRISGNPVLLTAYGAYEDVIESEFDADLLSLLDRGVVYAVAHVRGGGDLGRRWYVAGRGLHKRRSISDFIACAEHLISSGIVEHGKLVVSGESAGGLLVGAALNERPDLFCGAVAEVPFVDVVHTLLDQDWPLTPSDYDEFGDPYEAEHFQNLRSYSPYDNVRAQAYPPILASAAENDQRVPFWEAVKWIARLRVAQTANAPILLQLDARSGHHGASDRFTEADEIALTYAFILSCFGLVATSDVVVAHSAVAN